MSLNKTIDSLNYQIDKMNYEATETTYIGDFELTFYSKEQFPDSPTSTGVMPEVGRTIAVDPNVIPYGTAVWIDGFGVRYAEDTGSAIKGNRIDVFVETTEEAIQLGRKPNVSLYKINKGVVK